MSKHARRKHHSLTQEPTIPQPVAYHDEEIIAIRAYGLWEDRGKPIGSPEIDWFKAEAELNAELEPVRSNE